jgi:hypothetical protein
LLLRRRLEDAVRIPESAREGASRPGSELFHQQLLVFDIAVIECEHAALDRDGNKAVLADFRLIIERMRPWIVKF